MGKLHFKPYFCVHEKKKREKYCTRKGDLGGETRRERVNVNKWWRERKGEETETCLLVFVTFRYTY